MPLSVLGIGFGLSMIPANTAAVRALPGDGVGVASGILSMLRQMGVVFGVGFHTSIIARCSSVLI